VKERVCELEKVFGSLFIICVYMRVCDCECVREREEKYCVCYKKSVCVRKR
jgi:hypothetical protein